MIQFNSGSWRQCALCSVIALVAACSDRSSVPAAAANAAQPSTAAAAGTAPVAPASQQQNATVAELLSGSDSQASAEVNQSSSVPRQPTAGSGSEASESVAPESGDVEYARVVSVAPVTGPHRVCTNETVTEQRKPSDQHQVAGTLIGAIAGGVIGHQIGGGRGRTLATVGGAVGGGVVGKEVQKNQQSKDTVTRVVKHCRMVDESAANAPVYDVVYAYQGQNFHVRLDHDPGDRLALPVRGIINE